MSEQMWFGTRLNMRWIKQVQPEAGYGQIGWSGDSQFINGGGRVRRSKAAQRQFPMSWYGTDEELRHVSDYADGIYDTSDAVELIYFLTPDAMRTNAASKQYAFPAQADGMPLIRDLAPELVATTANTLDYPARSAKYKIAGTETAAPLYIPIPPGYTAWVGAHGSASGSGVNVTPYNGSTASAATALTLLVETDTTRVNASFSSSTYTGIEIAPKIAAGTLTLSAVIVQVLRNGVTPSTGGYIGGEGHGGCQFSGDLKRSIYQVTETETKISLTALLKETAQWL